MPQTSLKFHVAGLALRVPGPCLALRMHGPWRAWAVPGPWAGLGHAWAASLKHEAQPRPFWRAVLARPITVQGRAVPNLLL
ncbi:hypothetical protein L484_026471 [Morus notabilis]|uniref:Uncharacterized protein n=1 Tax=Morus notabilis TaxID=981085 RepID=W9QYY9_9ROSA|nr:hypothetical protein L484_026471 [Morus notabilis]